MKTIARKFSLSKQEMKMLKYKKMSMEGKTEKQAEKEIQDVVKSLRNIKNHKIEEEKRIDPEQRFKQSFKELTYRARSPGLRR